MGENCQVVNMFEGHVVSNINLYEYTHIIWPNAKRLVQSKELMDVQFMEIKFCSPQYL